MRSPVKLLSLYNTCYQKLFVIILLILSLIVATFYFSESTNNRLAADDFAYTNLVTDYGFIGAQPREYEVWSGRFTSTFFITLVGNLVKSSGNLTLYTAVSLACLLLGFYFLSEKLFINTTVIKRFLFSLLMFCSLIMTTPNIAESVYWLSGSITYLWPIIYFLFLVNTLEKDLKTRVDYFIIFALSIMLASSNEIAGIIFLAYISYTIIRKLLLRDNGHLRHLVHILCIAIVSFLIMYKSPGNAVRGSHFTQLSLINAVYKSIGGAVYIIYQYFLRYALYYLSLAIVISTFFTPRKLRYFKSAKILVMDLLFILLLAIIYSLPAQTMMGVPPPARAHIILAFILLYFVFLASLFLLKWRVFPNLLLIIASLYITTVYIRLFKNLSVSLKTDSQYSQEYDQIFRSLENAGVDDMVTLTPISSSKFIYPIGLAEDSNNWINKDVSKFFEVSSVKIDFARNSN